MTALANPQLQLRALVVGSEQKLAMHFEQVCSEVRHLKLVRTIPRYPAREEFIRLLRIYVPHIVFVQVKNVNAAMELLNIMKAEAPGIQFAGLHDNCDATLLLDLMRRGVQELLYAPFSKEQVWDYLVRAKEGLEKHPAHLMGSDLVYAFLPSKPGVGATTLAVNTAGALSREKDTRTFLADFDLSCGLMRFVLQLKNTHSVLDAAEKADNIDETIWPQLVTSFGSLDVIHAGALNPQNRLDIYHLRSLLEYVRRAYNIICADLSGNMEKYSLEIMHEAKQIFLVTTPELPSLHLAREKYQFLSNLDLGDRVSILLNRVAKDNVLSHQEIESLVGRPVLMSFPNDYRSVHHAVAAGTFLRGSTSLAAKCAELAKGMMAGKKVNAITTKRRFLEYFSVIPATYRLERS
jgi:pilus assembly protein CpaE